MKEGNRKGRVCGRVRRRGERRKGKGGRGKRKGRKEREDRKRKASRFSACPSIHQL